MKQSPENTFIPYVVIGNPRASMQDLLEKMQSFSIRTIGVYTEKKLYEMLGSTHYPSLLDDSLFCSGSVESDTENIQHIVSQKGGRLLFCFLGYELDVSYLEKLFIKLLPNKANDPLTSHYRCMKYYMQEILEENHLPKIKQVLLHESDQRLSDILKLTSDFNYPIVVKPDFESYCAADVNICETFDELKQMIPHMFLKMSDYERKYQSVLVQEFIHGTQYFVDTFSDQGKNYFCGVYKTTKEKRPGYQKLSRIWDLQNLCNPQLTEALEQYVGKVLTALGLKNGFSHTEVICMSDGSFRLIEVNPRISGVYGIFVYTTDEAIDCSQPATLCRVLKGISYTPKKNSHLFYRVLVVYNFDYCYEGIDVQKIVSLSSYYSHRIIKPDDRENKKIELLSQLSTLIVLRHEDSNELEKDTQIILTHEKEGTLFLNPKKKIFEHV